MKTYYRHKCALLQFESKITDCFLQKFIWEEIKDEDLIKFHQQQINQLELKKEHYLNNLLKSLNNTEITEVNCLEIKECYQLIEQYSKIHYSSLFNAHLNKTIEKHQKEYGDFIIRNQFSKANKKERTIANLERIYCS